MDRHFVITAGSIAASFIVASGAVAQTGVLSGVIFDETNRFGLSGVQVAIKGTDLVGVTNKDGKFTITGVPAGVREIEAWRFGYRNFKLSVLRFAANDTARVTLALSVRPASDPVVVAADDAMMTLDGITWVTKGDVITGDEINIRLPAHLRAETMPLQIVDGVIQIGESPPKLLPEDIETIEIVKGTAAAALYGARAVNGAIVIKTRK